LGLRGLAGSVQARHTISFGGDSPSREIGADALPVYWRASERFEVQVRAYGMIAIPSDRNRVSVQWALIWVSLCGGVILWWKRGGRAHWVPGVAALACFFPMIMALHGTASDYRWKDDSPVISLLQFGIGPSVVIVACAIGLAGLLGPRERGGNPVILALAHGFRWAATCLAGIAWMILVVMTAFAGRAEADLLIWGLVSLMIATAPVAALWAPAIRRSARWTGVMVIATTPLFWPAFWEVFKPGW